MTTAWGGQVSNCRRGDMLKLLLGMPSGDARCRLREHDDATGGNGSEHRDVTGDEPGFPAGTLEKPSGKDGRHTATGERADLLDKRDTAGTKACGEKLSEESGLRSVHGGVANRQHEHHGQPYKLLMARVNEYKERKGHHELQQGTAEVYRSPSDTIGDGTEERQRE